MQSALVPDHLNKLRYTNCEFKCSQTIRLTMILGCILILAMLLYILGRLSVFYISVWQISFLIIALIFVSQSAGRQVVEGKLVQRKREKLLNSKDVNERNQAHDVDLDDD
jgi:hypothetical protein